MKKTINETIPSSCDDTSRLVDWSLSLRFLALDTTQFVSRLCKTYCWMGNWTKQWYPKNNDKASSNTKLYTNDVPVIHGARRHADGMRTTWWWNRSGQSAFISHRLLRSRTTRATWLHCLTTWQRCTSHHEAHDMIAWRHDQLTALVRFPTPLTRPAAACCLLLLLLLLLCSTSIFRWIRFERSEIDAMRCVARFARPPRIGSEGDFDAMTKLFVEIGKQSSRQMLHKNYSKNILKRNLQFGN